MGGHAFLTPATRLSTAQLELLTAHAISHLAALFPSGLLTPKYLGDKTSHGDLDVLVAWDDPRSERMYGRARGVVPPIPRVPIPPAAVAVDSKVMCQATVEGQIEGEVKAEARVIGASEKEQIQEGEYDKVMRELAEKMGQAVGGLEWTRGGRVFSFKIPVTVICPDATDLDSKADDAFYQLDLILVHPSSLSLFHFLSSYSDTCTLVAQGIRAYSKSLTLHQHSFVLRHTAYPGLGPIDIELTRDPERFCEWTGLDYERWVTKRFESEEELWRWLTSADPESPLGRSWGRMAGEKRAWDFRAASGVKGRSESVGRFRGWLKMVENGWVRDAPPADQEELEGSKGKERGELPVDRFVRPALIADAMGHPAVSVPLDWRAEATLDFFAKQGEYEVALGRHREVVREMWELNRMRVEAARGSAVASELKERREVLEVCARLGDGARGGLEAMKLLDGGKEDGKQVMEAEMSSIRAGVRGTVEGVRGIVDGLRRWMEISGFIVGEGAEEAAE